jgi:glycosyltransferase involved in cell wall biosynthesis
MSPLRTIAVDLVPLLPGGDNGGAKIFTIELLRTLAKLHPETKFVLFTQTKSHDELASLDCANVSRLLVWGMKAKPSTWEWLSTGGKGALKVPVTLADRLRYVSRNLLGRPITPSLPRQIGADLLFCPFTAPLFYDPDIPTVCVVYDLQYKSYPQFFSSDEASQRERNFNNAARQSSAIAVISNYVRNAVAETGMISSERVFTIHIRLPYRLPQVEPSDAVQMLGRFDICSREYLFYPANFWRHKNHEMLLTGFLMARARGLRDRIKLVFTGAPCERMNELAAAVDMLGLKDYVVFAGFVSRTDFAALMENCLGVVFPSLYEGFGMPIIEAMAASCPVTCSDKTSLPEVAGDAALPFDPRIPAQVCDAIMRIATDEKLRMTLVDRGVRQASFFSRTAQMADEYWTVFENATLNIRAELSLQGVHDDGWSGPAIVLGYPRDRSERSVDVELHVPEWVAIKRFRATVRSSAARQTTRHVITAGESLTLHIPIGTESGRLAIEITPSFRPDNDDRKLSVMVKKLIVRGGNSSFVMFPRAS